ncbi:MAG: glycogen-binding domain-containing protein [Gemmatimonadaceae bacterium]
MTKLTLGTLWRAYALLLISGRIGAAQETRVSLDVGSSMVRYADSINANSIAVTPRISIAVPRASLAASGTFARLAEAWSNSGSVQAVVSTSVGRRFSTEVAGSAGGSSHSDGARTGQTIALGRLHVSRTASGAWGGGGFGRTWDGTLWRNLLQGTVGGWMMSSIGSAVVSLAHSAVDDTIRYTDALVTLQRATQRFELVGSLGARIGDPVPSLVTDRAWGSVSGVIWIRPGIGAVASAGTYPIDFTQGFPGGRFLSLGVRITGVRGTGASPDAPREPAVAEEAREFEVRAASAGRQRIRVNAPSVRSAELMGDFTNWRAIPMSAEGNGWWSVTVPIAEGTHEVNLRFNGGPWRVPPGLTPLRDEFGDSSGLLTIPWTSRR